MSPEKKTKYKIAVRPIVGGGAPHYDLSSHSERSARRSPHMSVMQVIVLHPCTKFEVHRPLRSEDTALISLVTLTFDL